MEHLLILTTVERIGDSLPYRPSSQRRSGGKLREYIQTLNEVVLLPTVPLHKVLQPLLNVFIEFSNQDAQNSKEKESKDKLSKLAKSRMIILQLCSDYLSYGIDKQNGYKLPNHFATPFFYENDEQDRLALAEEEEDEDDYFGEAISSNEFSEQGFDDTNDTVDASNSRSLHSYQNTKSGSVSFTGELGGSPGSFSSSPSSPGGITSPLQSRTKSFITRVKQTNEKKSTMTKKSMDVMVANFILKTTVEFLYSKAGPYRSSLEQLYDEKARYYCRDIIFKISITNFESVAHYLNECMNDAEQFQYIRFLENIFTHMKQIVDVLGTLSTKTFVKQAVTNPDITNAIRFLVWTWIENHPKEFHAMHAGKKEIESARKLFETLRSNLKKREDKPQLWPLLTTLMFLCPENLFNAIRSGGKGSDSFVTFIHKHLLPVLTGKSKDKVVTGCTLSALVDVFRAAANLPSSMNNSGIYMFAAIIEPKLLEIMFNENGSLPKNADGLTTDFALAARFIKYFYLHNPDRAKREIFYPCFEGNVEYKYAFSKALMMLVGDEPPANNTNVLLKDKFEAIAGAVRGMLSDVVQSDDDGQDVEEHITKKKGLLGQTKIVSTVTKHNYAPDIIDCLLHMYCLQPVLFLTKSNTEESLDIQEWFDVLTSAITEKNTPSIQEQIGRLFRKLYLPKFIDMWSGVDISLFSNITTQLLNNISSEILERPELESVLSIVRNITFKAKIYFKSRRDGITSELINDKKRLQGLEKLSSNLLVGLCTTNKEVWISITSCLKDICDQIEVLQNQDLKYLNYHFYRQLTSVNLNGDMVNERKIQIQLFKRVEIQTKSNVTAFDQLYSRWKSLAGTAIKNTEQFGSLTSLLCALGGAVIQLSQKRKVSRPGDADSQSKLDDFINDLMDHVVSPNVSIRQLVTVSIASDLAPALYEKLFMSMYERVKKLFGDMGEIKISANSNLFVDQAIYITKTVVESNESTYDLALATEMDSLLLILVQYCSRVLETEGIQMKCKLCYLIETAMSKSEYISFKDEQKFRTKLLNQLAEWTSAVSASDGDLDFVCMRAISSLLKGHKIKMDKQEDFYRYFTFLESFISKTNEKSGLRQFIISSLENLLHCNVSLGLQNYMTKVYTADENVRTIFLKLVASLIKRGLSLGEQDEEEKVVEVGKKEKYQDMMDFIFSYDLKAVFALLENVKNNDKDEICDSILNMFHWKGETQLLDLLKQSVEREVEHTIQPETLFRANSAASKLMKKYCLRVSAPYLKKCIGPLVEKICKEPQNFEVDPMKAQSRNEDVSKNAENVLRVLQEFLDAILDSTSYMPTTFRRYCNYLYEIVGKKFNGQTEAGDIQFEFKYIAVGGFLFLRLICPAITSPQLYGLYHDLPSNDSRRFCIVITKVLQNLANGIVSNKKEAFMQFSEQFVEKNIPVIKNFFENLSKEPEKPIGVDDEVKEDELESSKKVVHRFLFNYQEAMRPTLQQLTRSIVKDSNSNETEDVVCFDELSSILEALGKPPEQEKKRGKSKNTEDDFSSIYLSDFLNKCSKFESEIPEIEKIEFFYQKGNSKSDLPVFYFTPKKFDSHDKYLYFILKKLEPLWTKPYAMLVDCSDWDEKKEIAFNVFLKLSRCIPKGAKKNLKEVYVFNPNSTFKNSTKKLAPIVKKRIAKQSWHFCTGVDELSKVIAPEQQALSEETIKREKDVVDIFTNVSRVTSDQRLKETIIKICPDTLVVITKNEHIFGIETSRIDTFQLTSLGDVAVKKTLFGSKSDFTVKVDDPERNFHFRSANRDQIINALKNAIARVARNLAASNTLAMRKAVKPLRIQDIPGQLLNVAFLNLQSTCSSTRYEGYNLLTSLSKQFNFPDTKILESDVVNIPRNTEDLVCEFSSKLASSRPGLSLDFLLEALKGFEQVKAKSQILCVKYIKFWIPNLKDYLSMSEVEEQKDKTEKLAEFFESLTNVTCKFSEAFPALCDLWRMMASDENLTNFCLDKVIAQGIEKGAKDKESLALFCDLIVTIASKAHQFVSKKIVDMLEETIFLEQELENATTQTKIFALSRFLLSLSFQNQCNLQENLPKILNIITLLAGNGNTALRATIYAIACNVVHSICLELPPDNNNVKALQHASKLKKPEFVVAFMGNRDIIDPYSNAKESTNIDKTSMQQIEVLSIYFLELLSFFPDETAVVWVKQWTEVCMKSMNVKKSTYIARSICSFGVISPPDQCGNMIEHMLSYIGKVGISVLENSSSSDLSVSVMLGIVHLCNKIDMTTEANIRLAKKLFFVGIIVMCVSNETLFNSCTGMMTCILNVLFDSNELQNYQSLGQFFESIISEGNCQKFMQQFASKVRVNFKDHFSFSIAAIMMKGLVNPATRPNAVSLLKQFLIISNRVQYLTAHSLGFISALIAFEKQYNSPLYCEHLFQKEIFEHPKGETVFLFTKYLFNIVSELHDNEKLAIYKTLQFGFEAIPEVFRDVFRDHHSMSHVIKAYSHGTSDTIIESALSLFKSMSYGNSSKTALQMKEPFEEIGFSNFKELVKFEKKQSPASSLVIQFLVQNFSSKGMIGTGETTIEATKKKEQVETAPPTPSSSIPSQ